MSDTNQVHISNKVDNNQDHPNTVASVANKPIKRRRFMMFLLALCFSGYFVLPLKPRRINTKKKLVILGFDGCDPRLVEQWSDELPNLRQLREQGTYAQLMSTVPPESPVAWSSFAVGANPGQHGVYDFLRRPCGSYIPTAESFVEQEYARFIFKEIPVKMPKAKLRRGGTAFWDVLSENGLDTTMIEVPVTFPAPELSHGRVLSGLGVPDIRGQQATFHSFVYPAADAKDTTFGGKVVSLEQVKDKYRGQIFGPYDPVLGQEKREMESQQLEAWLTLCEWRAHIFSVHGEENVSAEEKRMLRQYFALRVVQPYSMNPYLQTEDIAQRMNTMKLFLQTGQSFVKRSDEKGRPVLASIAREEIGKATKKIEEIREELSKLSKPIFTYVQFKPMENHSIEIRYQDQVQKVAVNEWSDWFTLTFKVTSLISINAVCRFYPQEVEAEKLNIYMTSPDIDPRNPAISVSHPGEYSEELAEWLGGPYKTRGWAAETHGLKDNRLSEEGFIKDLFCLMDLREAKTFETYERSDSNVFISVFSETDRVAHMFYWLIDPEHPMYNPEMAQKYGDTFKKVYKRMDEIVGRMMRKVATEPDTTLMVMSDHGFSSWRYQVSLNTWLVKNGFMAVKGNALKSEDMKLEDLITAGQAEFFSYVDWDKTQAYSLGLGQIYINLEGRESLGAVKPEEYEQVCDAICSKLVELRDNRPGRNNVPVIAYARKRSEIWSGPYANDEHDCPDIQVGFHTGYRVSWQTCMGGLSEHILEDNLEKWSGDHCSLATEEVPGMFYCNRKLNLDLVSIYDFAPTILKYFEFDVPEAMEGKDLMAQG
ncbi:MAG: alkaline phosphatase family protein [bacterium]|jgi:predicted AlkP superfamily phosphohydrolase/phosphomutase